MSRIKMRAICSNGREHIFERDAQEAIKMIFQNDRAVKTNDEPQWTFEFVNNRQALDKVIK